MTGWAITVEAAGEPAAPTLDFDQALVDLADLLADHHAAVSGRTDRTRVTITTSVDGKADLGQEIEKACDRAEAAIDKVGLPAWSVVRVDAMTYDEQDRELDTPNFPELVGIAEVAEILGVTRQRASQLQTKATFPAPVAVLKAGPVWTRPSLNRFVDNWARTPGRQPRHGIGYEYTIDGEVHTVHASSATTLDDGSTSFRLGDHEVARTRIDAHSLRRL